VVTGARRIHAEREAAATNDDSAHMESLFKTLKSNIYHEYEYYSAHALRLRFVSYVDFYTALICISPGISNTDRVSSKHVHN
jgi:hypothetical protein